MERKHVLIINRSIDQIEELNDTLTILSKSNNTHMIIQMAGIKMLRICCRFMLDNLKLLVEL